MEKNCPTKDCPVVYGKNGSLENIISTNFSPSWLGILEKIKQQEINFNKDKTTNLVYGGSSTNIWHSTKFLNGFDHTKTNIHSVVLIKPSHLFVQYGDTNAKVKSLPVENTPSPILVFKIVNQSAWTSIPETKLLTNIVKDPKWRKSSLAMTRMAAKVVSSLLFMLNQHLSPKEWDVALFSQSTLLLHYLLLPPYAPSNFPPINVRNARSTVFL